MMMEGRWDAMRKVREAEQEEARVDAGIAKVAAQAEKEEKQRRAQAESNRGGDADPSSPEAN